MSASDVFVRAETQPCICYTNPKGEHCGCSRSGALKTAAGPKAYALDCGADELRADASEDIFGSIMAVNRAAPILKWSWSDEIPLLVGHDARRRVGRVDVTAKHADGSLRVRLRLDASSEAGRLAAGIRAGIIRPLSPGWTVLPFRGLEHVGVLSEVSLVGTSRNVECRIDAAAQREAFERIDAGGSFSELRATLEVERLRLDATAGGFPYSLMNVRGRVSDVDARTRSATVSVVLDADACDFSRFYDLAPVVFHGDQASPPVAVVEEALAHRSIGGLQARVRFGAYSPIAAAVWAGVQSGAIHDVGVMFDSVAGAKRLNALSINP